MILLARAASPLSVPRPLPLATGRADWVDSGVNSEKLVERVDEPRTSQASHGETSDSIKLGQGESQRVDRVVCPNRWGSTNHLKASERKRVLA